MGKFETRFRNIWRAVHSNVAFCMFCIVSYACETFLCPLKLNKSVLPRYFIVIFMTRNFYLIRVGI